MANEPGEAGQRILQGAYEGATIVRENLKPRNLEAKIQVEGNCDAKSADLFADTSPAILVLDESTIFDGEDSPETFSRFVNSDAEHRNIV